MTGIRKKQEEKNLKILRELLTFETNKYCFDCNQRGPTYVNITIGSFVCTNCGGALRKYSHRLKSISMSNFSQIEMDFIKKRGNNICKRIYYGLCENNVPPEMDIKNGMLDSHLRAKYELKKWYLEPPSELEEETLVQNQVIFDRVERGVPKPVKSYTANSSSNIIIEPPKQPSGKASVSASVSASRAGGSRTSIELAEGLSSTKAPADTAIDPSRLGGGSAVRLPMPMPADLKGSDWTTSSDAKTNQNVQSLFGDDFLFASPRESAAAFAAIPKSQTMTFNTHPLVPVQPVVAGTHQAAAAGVSHQGESRGFGDKYAALAELDDLFSGAGVSRQPVFSSPQAQQPPQQAQAPPQWAAQPAWPPSNSTSASASASTTYNPFSGPAPASAASAFNPFSSSAAPGGEGGWPGTQHPANPFLVPSSSTNPFL